jgi:hypothetical protein
MSSKGVVFSEPAADRTGMHCSNLTGIMAQRGKRRISSGWLGVVSGHLIRRSGLRSRPFGLIETSLVLSVTPGHQART